MEKTLKARLKEECRGLGNEEQALQSKTGLRSGKGVSAQRDATVGHRVAGQDGKTGARAAPARLSPHAHPVEAHELRSRLNESSAARQIPSKTKGCALLYDSEMAETKGCFTKPIKDMIYINLFKGIHLYCSNKL